jgi:hypothetical protein
MRDGSAQATIRWGEPALFDLRKRVVLMTFSAQPTELSGEDYDVFEKPVRDSDKETI